MARRVTYCALRTVRVDTATVCMATVSVPLASLVAPVTFPVQKGPGGPTVPKSANATSSTPDTAMQG